MYSTKTDRPSQDSRPKNPTDYVDDSRVNSQSQYSSQGSNYGEDIKNLPDQSSNSHAPGEENPYDYAPKSDYSAYAPKGYADYTKNDE